MHFKHIALIGKYQATDITSHVVSLAKHIHSLGINTYIDCGEFCSLDDFAAIHEFQPNPQNSQNIQTGNLKNWLDILDLVIVIGGDGTLLAAAREIVDHDIPIVGVNQGKLGFMTDIAVDDVTQSIDKILFH